MPRTMTNPRHIVHNSFQTEHSLTRDANVDRNDIRLPFYIAQTNFIMHDATIAVGYKQKQYSKPKPH